MSTEDLKDVGSNLTPIAEYTETAAALADLRQRHAGVLYDVTVPKQMKAAREARAELRGLRTALEKKRVEIKAPALERCRLIDAEAKRLTGELYSLEEPIDVQVKVEETRAESERLTKLEAERLRVEAIQQRIDEIRNLPATLVGKPAVIINGQLEKLKGDEPREDDFAEHYVVARDAHTASIARVEQLLQAQADAEAESRRIADERAELTWLREQAEARQREDDRRAVEVREQAEASQREAERRAAELRAEADRIAQEERDRLAAIERGEVMRKSAEARDQLFAERTAHEATVQAERERLATEQRKLDDQAEKLKLQKRAAAKKAEADRLAGLGLREAAQAVVVWASENWHDTKQAFRDLEAALDNEAAPAKPARAKKAARA